MKITLLFLFFLLPLSAYPQKYEDVLYHSNGTVIRGKLLEKSPEGNIRIMNHSGDIWVFSPEEVDTVRSEKTFDYEAFIFNSDGREYTFSADLLIHSGGGSIGNDVIPGINFGTFYRTRTIMSTGLEAGIALYEWTVMPVSASFRLRTSERTASPVMRVSAGYSFPLEKRPDDFQFSYNSKGGFNFSAGIGFEKIVNKDLAFLLGFSWQYQGLNFHLEPNNNNWIVERNRRETYNRLRITLMYIIK